MWKIGRDGPEFDLLKNVSNRMAHLGYSHESTSFKEFKDCHPNMYAKLMKEHQKKMDDGVFFNEEDKGLCYDEYIMTLSEEQIEQILDDGVRFKLV